MWKPKITYATEPEPSLLSSPREILGETWLSHCLACEENLSYIQDVSPLPNKKMLYSAFLSGTQMTSNDTK